MLSIGNAYAALLLDLRVDNYELIAMTSFSNITSFPKVFGLLFSFMTFKISYIMLSTLITRRTINHLHK